MTALLNTANTVRNINSKLNTPKTVKIIRDLRNSRKPKISPNYKIEIFADKNINFHRQNIEKPYWNCNTFTRRGQ